MIDMNDLRPILQVLVEGRDDSADILEQITGIDREVEAGFTQADIDTAVDAARSEARAEYNDRYMKAFFNPETATGSPGAEASDNEDATPDAVDNADGAPDPTVTMADVVAEMERDNE